MRKRFGNDNSFWSSLISNQMEWQMYFNRLVELSVSMFDWQNLPPTIDSRFMELVLFAEGRCVFFEDKDLGFLALRCSIGGHFNVYRIPIKRYVIADNGYHKRLTIKNSVLIYNNYLHTPSRLEVEVFAKRLWDLDCSIDTNARAQKTPIIITCDESERLTLQNLYKEYVGNAPVIYGTKKLNVDALKVLQTNAPFVADKLYTLKTQIWNEALTFLGINNMNLTKKERLVTDEVTRNQGGIIASRYSRLKMRQKACKEINEMFGTNIWVEYSKDTRIAEDIVDENDDNEGGDNNE